MQQSSLYNKLAATAVAWLRRDNEATASFFSEARVQVSISHLFSSSAWRW